MKTLKLFTFLILSSFFANAQSNHVISALLVTNNYLNVVPNYPILVIDSSSSGAFPIINIYNYITDVNGQFQDSIITAGTTGTLWFLAPDSCGFATMTISYSPNSPTTLATAGIVLCNNIIGGVGANCNYTVSALPVAGFPNQAAFGYSGQGGSTYLWTFGDGTSSSQPSPSHTYAQAGTYSYCLQIDSCPPVCGTVTVFNSGGCNPYFVYGTNGTTVSIFPWLLTGQFQAIVDWGDGIQDTFTPQNIPSLPNNITHTYSVAGTYQICFTHSNAQLGCSNTYCETVTVGSGSNLQCSANFLIDTVNSFAGNVVIWNTSIFNTTATTVTNFLWNFGDGFTSTQPFPAHSYAGPGMYNVCLTVNTYDNATQDSCSSIFCDSLGVDANGNIIYKGAIAGWTLNVLNPNSIGIEEDKLTELSSFPNPVKDVLNISIPNEIEDNIMLSIYSISGVRVIQMLPGSVARTIDMSYLPNGMYLLQVEYAGEVKTMKIIKQD